MAFTSNSMNRLAISGLMGEDNSSQVPFWFLTSTPLPPCGEVCYKLLPLLLCRPLWGASGNDSEVGASG